MLESVMSRKLYVGNLPFQTTESDLEQLFASAGDVASVTVMRDRETGRARGFAFVEMASDEGASQAIDTLNNTSYGGRNLTVNEARPQERREGGFGGSRGGGGGGGRRTEPRW
jgi:RNA recognition motif-containing protein